MTGSVILFLSVFPSRRSYLKPVPGFLNPTAVKSPAFYFFFFPWAGDSAVGNETGASFGPALIFLRLDRAGP